MAEFALDVRDLVIRQGAFCLGPISFQIPAGAHALLIGPTGAGKTTLIEVFAGLRPAQSGAIDSFGVNLVPFPPGDRGLGYVPQDAVLFPTLTVRENLGFGLAIRKTERSIQTQRIGELAGRLKLTAILDRKAVGLSGGEAQRVSLGRALAFRPKLLLLDEPMSAIDDDTKEAVLDVLESESTSVLHVSHDRPEVERLADLVYKLQLGPSQPHLVRVR